jgi:beta-alanine--pyruvate transaminase
MEKSFHTESAMVRITGDTLALSPPLVISESQIGELFDKIGRAIRAVS